MQCTAVTVCAVTIRQQSVAYCVFRQYKVNHCTSHVSLTTHLVIFIYCLRLKIA